MKKVLALVLLVVAVGVAVAVAAVTVPSDAASVDGTTISRQALNTDLAAIAGSQQYQCYLRVEGLLTTGQSPLPVNGVGVASGNTALGYAAPNPATYSASFAGYWLNLTIDAEVLAQANARRGVVITPFDVAHARVALETVMTHALQVGAQNGLGCGSTSAAGVLATLPKSFVNQLVLQWANQIAFIFSAAGSTLDPASVAAYFAAHQRDFHNVCVVQLPVSTKAEATQALAAVAAGTSFASLAQQNGGTEGCGPPALSAYLAAAAQLKPGQITSPLANGQQGFLLVQLVSDRPSTAAAQTDNLIQAIVNGDHNASAALANAVDRESHVTVDPRYGHWVAAPVFTVDPPTAPDAADVPCAAANDPLAAVAVCPAPRTAHAAGAR